MSSRDTVLQALRRAEPTAVPLPTWQGPTIRFDDPVATFVETVKAVGGSSRRVPDLAAADAAVRELEVWQRAKVTVSRVPGVGASSIDADALATPGELRDLDVSVVGGAPAVAENGAVWVTGADLGRHRAVLFIAEHLVLVVKGADIVHTMHDAYEKVRLERPGWGTFVAGPSKTADIEQSLVIGAHGPRSCLVLVVG
jgi:L-lactate dehydrogenase complex protein LldG